MEEIWKDIEGYEGLYQISNFSRVKSLQRIVIRKNGKKLPIHEKILIPATHYKGYKIIKLSNVEKTKTLKIHRLIAIAFIPNPKKLSQINHLNGIKDDNRIENLEWVSNRENCTHKFFGKSKSSKYPGVSFDKATGKWIVIIQLNGVLKNFGTFHSEDLAYEKSKSVLIANGIENKYAIA